jgi:hypothetical protein
MFTQKSNQLFYKVAVLVVLVALGFGVLALIGYSGQQVANAAVAPDGQSGKCTHKTLKGTYLFEGGGVFIEDGEVIHYAEAGFQNFDGQGNFDGFYSSTLNGEPLDSQQYFTGTYVHNSDCVYTNYAPVGEGELIVHMYTTPKGTYLTYSGPGSSGTAMKP